MTLLCQHCVCDADDDYVRASVFMCGLCPACRPTACPDCGCGDIGYSVVDRRWYCDNSCGPFTHAEVLG